MIWEDYTEGYVSSRSAFGKSIMDREQLSQAGPLVR